MEGAFHYAGFWWRFVAALLDLLIIWVASFAVGVFFDPFGIGAFRIDPFGSDNFGGIFYVAYNVDADLLGLGNVVAIWFYFALQESSSRQATIGKRCCGIVVTDLNGKRISFSRASGRHFGKLVSSFILMIGYMMAGWTRRKQALHDIMAECLVLRRKPEVILLPASGGGATT